MPNESDELSQLKNLGTTSVNILNAIGIHTYADLQAAGPVEAYLRVKKQGIKVSRVMLYALQGALMDIHWTQLDPALKAQLLEEAESKL